MLPLSYLLNSTTVTFLSSSAVKLKCFPLPVSQAPLKCGVFLHVASWILPLLSKKELSVIEGHYTSLHFKSEHLLKASLPLSLCKHQFFTLYDILKCISVCVMFFKVDT